MKPAMLEAVRRLAAAAMEDGGGVPVAEAAHKELGRWTMVLLDERELLAAVAVKAEELLVQVEGREMVYGRTRDALREALSASARAGALW